MQKKARRAIRCQQYGKRDHERPCRACAALRAKAYRQTHPSDRHRTPEQLARVRAIAAAHTAIKRGTILPPHRCDRCGEGAVARFIRGRSGDLVFRIPDANAPRRLVWICRTCLAIVDHSGDTVVPKWTWPGAVLPKRHRYAVAFDRAAHTYALTKAGAVPVRERGKAYVDAYLEQLGATAERWIAQGLRAEGMWAPVPVDIAANATLNELWRRYISTWRQSRQRSIPEDPSDAVELQARRRTTPPRRRRHTILDAVERATTRTEGPRAPATRSDDEVLLRVAALEAEADARLAAVEEQMRQLVGNRWDRKGEPADHDL